MCRINLHIGPRLRAPPALPSQYAPRRLLPAERSALLARVIDHVRRLRGRAGAGGRRCFDLDAGTILDNRPRGGRHPPRARRSLASPPTRGGRRFSSRPRQRRTCIVYGVVENLRQRGVAAPALHREGFAFWKDRFFHDPHHRHDVEVKGARTFAWACHDAGAVVVYLTGRDLANMALGTFKSHRDLGFPIGIIGTGAAW